MDEEFGLRELQAIARQLGLDLYRWSLTRGLELQVGPDFAPYERTLEPVAMLKQVESLCESRSHQPGLFVLVDFDRHLEDNMVLRLFKDAVARVRGSRDTFVILAHDYRLPASLEPDTACIRGGYPAEHELVGVVKEALPKWDASSPASRST